MKAIDVSDFSFEIPVILCFGIDLVLGFRDSLVPVLVFELVFCTYDIIEL